jgi:myo-inositol-1(or 4)-monophosphatase
VAAGFTDAFFETGLSIWDVAAGSLLVTEAGGLIGNFTGEPEFLDQRECLAGAPRIYGQLVPLLAKYSKFAGLDDKLRASDRVRAVDPSTSAADIYARSTIEAADLAPADDGAAAPAASAAPRKLTRIRREAPATPVTPAEGDAAGQ